MSNIIPPLENLSNARKGAVRKRSQFKATLDGATAWTKRNKGSGEFMAVKMPVGQKVAAQKFKGVRAETTRSVCRSG